MRIQRLLFAFIFLPFISFGQIPNSSFESWTNLVPDGWSINCSPPLLMPVSSSSDAHTGNYALKGEVVNDGGIPFGPYIIPVTTGLGFPVTQNDTMLYGFYKANLLGGDLGLIEVWVYDSLHIQVGSGFTYLNSSTFYTEFSIPIIYTPGANASEMSIIIQMTDTNGVSAAFNVGSYFLIDDLSYLHTSTVNADEIQKSTFSISPNPASDFITLDKSSLNSKNFLISIFDITGKKVFNAKSELNQNTIDVHEIPSGTYILVVAGDKQIHSQKIVISR